MAAITHSGAPARDSSAAPGVVEAVLPIIALGALYFATHPFNGIAGDAMITWAAPWLTSIRPESGAT